MLIIPMMLAGLVVVIGMFLLRVAGLVAAVAGGFALLEAVGACAAYSRAPTPAHLLALQQSGSFAAMCIAMVIASWFGPALFSRRR